MPPYICLNSIAMGLTFSHVNCSTTGHNQNFANIMIPPKQKRQDPKQPGAMYLNMEHLLSMANGDQTVLSMLIHKSVITLEDSAISLEQALRNNPVAFRRGLHKLKGSLGIIEPENLYPMCRDLDKNFLTMMEDERYERSRFLLQGVSFLLQELKGVSTNDIQ
jgi:hypothetical protein